MQTNFPFVELPDALEPIIGKREPGTRIYRRDGSQEESAVWFDLLTELIASAGEPAPTSNYVPPGIGKVCSHILWRETFYKASINDTPGAKQKAFVRAVLKLQEAKLIGVWSDKVWLAGRVK